MGGDSWRIRGERQPQLRAHLVHAQHAEAEVDFALLEVQVAVAGDGVVGGEEESACGVEQRDELLVEFLVAAAEARADGLGGVLLLGGLEVGEVRVGREEGDGDVEGVADVLARRAVVGEGGEVAHRLRQELHAQGGVGDEDSARAVAAKLLVPGGLEALALVLADGLLGADDRVRQGVILEARPTEERRVAHEFRLVVAGAEGRQAREVRLARVGVAEGDDLVRREALDAVAGAVEVGIDEVRTVRLAERRDEVRRERPDTIGDAERARLEEPVGAADDLLGERRQLPQVEGVVDGIDLGEERQERMLRHLLDVFDGARERLQVREGTQAVQRAGRERSRQAARGGLASARRDVEARRVGGADGGVEARAGPRGGLQLGEQIPRRGTAQPAGGRDAGHRGTGRRGQPVGHPGENAGQRADHDSGVQEELSVVSYQLSEGDHYSGVHREEVSGGRSSFWESSGAGPRRKRARNRVSRPATR